MPCSVTHTYFAKDVYDRLDKNIQKKINFKMLKTFAQGPDVLFFYNITNLKKGKEIREFGKYVQKNKTQDFFINLIKYITDNKLHNNKEVMSFLYGFIMHYSLDKTIHPFIFYKTGIFHKNKKETYKYNGLHLDMETYIDCYMIYNNEKSIPKKFKLHNFFYNVDEFSNDVINTIDYVFNTTFEKDNIGAIYYKSIKHMKTFTRLFRYDPLGTKKVFYKYIDFISLKRFLKKEPLSYCVHHKRKIHYLNLEKKKWNHPKDENEIYNYSFIELYSIALKDAIKIINSVNSVIYKKRSISDLKTIFPNLSYTAGKECTTKLKSKYFEF